MCEFQVYQWEEVRSSSSCRINGFRRVHAGHIETVDSRVLVLDRWAARQCDDSDQPGVHVQPRGDRFDVAAWRWYAHGDA